MFERSKSHFKKLFIGLLIAFPSIGISATTLPENLELSACSLAMERAFGHEDPAVIQFHETWEKESAKKRTDIPNFGKTLSPRHSDPKFQTNTRVQIAPDLNTLNTIVENISLLLVSKTIKPYNFTERELRFFRSIQEEALTQSSNSKVLYDDYINLSFYFTVAMVRKSEKAPGPKSIEYRNNVNFAEFGEDLIDPDLSRGRWWPDLKRVVEQAPRVLLLPTFRNLNKVAFNDLRPYPIYYLGLTLDPNEKDENPNQLLFLIHDVAHAVIMAEADLKDPRLRGQNANKAVLQRLIFKNSFESQLMQIPNARLRQVIQDTWFEIFHEQPRIPYNKKGLREALSRSHPPEMIAFESDALKGLSMARKTDVARKAIAWLRTFSND